MDELTIRIGQAQTSADAMNQLLVDYTPFIRLEASKTQVRGMDHDDKVSIAMLVFLSCVRQYRPDRGGFIGFARTCIRNRLLDEGSRAMRREGSVQLLDAAAKDHLEYASSQEQYDEAQERQDLAEEIDALASALSAFGIELSGLPAICPKQRRSRQLCARLARAVAGDALMRETLLTRHVLSQRSLAERFQLSEKTIEKHRKYIVTSAIILIGDYPGIRAFLPEGDD